MSELFFAAHRNDVKKLTEPLDAGADLEDCLLLGDRLADSKVFGPEGALALRHVIGEIRRDNARPDISGQGSTYYRLSEAAVKYCHERPELLPYVPGVAVAKPPVVRKRQKQP